MDRLPNKCAVLWCEETAVAHQWHQAVLATWRGTDPRASDVTRWVQLVAYAPAPRGPLPVTPELALTITGPDMRQPDRVSVALTSEQWRQLVSAELP